MTDHLEYFDGAFDHKIASAGGEIVPYPGFAQDFDEIDETLKRLNSEFAAYLDKAKSILK